MSSTGLDVDVGLIGFRERLLYEMADGSFEIGTIATTGLLSGAPVPKYQNSGSSLPAPGYAYVGMAVDRDDGSQFPVFYSQAADVYFVQGVDRVKYGLTYSEGYAADGAGLYSTTELAYEPGGPGGAPAAGHYTEVLTYDYATETETDVIATPACYAAGTRVLTEAGEVAVERIRAGDRVVTASGAVRAVRWMGHRAYAGRFLASNPAVQPVRFRAGCLGAGLPRRDLLVSPEHAMFLDGLLIPARCLVNGTTIVRERGREQVEYHHLELDSHDVILAEGAASETFEDDDSRGVFHNAGEWRGAARPGGAAVFCAPRVECGAGLDAVRRRLAGLDRGPRVVEQSREMDCSTTDVPTLDHLHRSTATSLACMAS